jgi:hypothetical protein
MRQMRRHAAQNRHIGGRIVEVRDSGNTAHG